MGKSAAVCDQKTEFEIVRDWNGFQQVLLRVPSGASARKKNESFFQVCLYGGQIISWRNERGEELLFTSCKANLKPPKALRGGVSIYFPQFGHYGSLEQHGFTRNKMWSIDCDPPALHPNDSNGKACLDLLLKPLDAELKSWPHCFEFRLRVSLSMDGDLTVISRVRNINGKPFSFSFAYHTYFSVSDISEVRVEGLETLDYLDNLCQENVLRSKEMR
ncbi:hypothetical protein KSP40_PGU008129 [Platanthera guangdongensis]|uniref:Glucose-6-phosphate 1-epimerase n=1 Tax=Platanthera guangdongensis TaxID=2320717 RepID=A0ABR2M6B0_9ASPA